MLAVYILKLFFPVIFILLNISLGKRLNDEQTDKPKDNRTDEPMSLDHCKTSNKRSWRLFVQIGLSPHLLMEMAAKTARRLLVHTLSD